MLKSFDVYFSKDLLIAHNILMEGLIPDAGRFRSKSVGIMRQDGVAHVAPLVGLVPTHVENLFSFLKNDREHHVLVKASVFHYELEFIHPFSDGNGRIGRLWEHAILADWHPVFEFISIESMVKENQDAYYAALEKADNKASCEDFVEFGLHMVLLSLQRFFSRLKPEPVTAQDRLEIAKAKLGNRNFSRKDYLDLFKTISTATASRDLKYGTDSGFLTRSGDKRNAFYFFPNNV